MSSIRTLVNLRSPSQYNGRRASPIVKLISSDNMAIKVRACHLEANSVPLYMHYLVTQAESRSESASSTHDDPVGRPHTTVLENTDSVPSITTTIPSDDTESSGSSSGISHDGTEVSHTSKGDAMPSIDISADNEIMRRFVALMVENGVDIELTCDDAEAVLDLCIEYRCGKIADRVLLRLYGNVAIAPWRIFCIASHHDNVHLARAALAVMDGDSELGPDPFADMPEETWDECAKPYLFAFMRALRASQNTEAAQRETGNVYNWASLSKRFELKGKRARSDNTAGSGSNKRARYL